MAHLDIFVENEYLASKQAQLASIGINLNLVDIRSAILQNFATVRDHFAAKYIEEKTSPSVLFNHFEYVQAKTDALNANNPKASGVWTFQEVEVALQTAFGSSLAHFLNVGYKETNAQGTVGINPSNAFDLNAYYTAKANSIGGLTAQQVADAIGAVSGNPIKHITTFANEGFTAQAPAVQVNNPGFGGSGANVNVGSTFNLTTAADIGQAFTGTSQNDTYIAQDVGGNATLTALDRLDGQGGTDTLRVLYQNSQVNVGGAVATGIETLDLQNAFGDGNAGNASAINTTQWTGLTTVNMTNTGDDTTLTVANTTAVNASNAAANIDLIINGGSSVTVAQTLDNADDSVTIDGAVNVNVTATNSNAAAGGIAIGANTAVTGTVQVSSTGAAIVGGTGAVAMDTVNVTGGSTVSVTQSANTAAGNAATAAIGTDVVTQGAVTVTGGAGTTSVTVTQDDQVAAVAAVNAVAGVNQTQVVTFSALTAGQTAIVNGLTFTASVNLTAEQVAQAFANLANGGTGSTTGPVGNGVYTGANNAAAFTSGPAVGATVTYSEVVAGTNAGAIAVGGTGTNPTVAAGVAGVTAVAAVTGVAGIANGAVVIDDNATKSITDIVVDGYGAGATLGGAAAGTSLDSLTNLTLNNSGAGAAALRTAATALTLNMNDVDGTVNLDVGAASITNLTINTSGVASTGVITANAATSVTINAEAAISGASNFGAATTFDVNGSAAVNLTGATTDSAALTIDASGNAGGVTAVLGATNATFTGGTGADVVTTGAAAILATDNILMGDGNDTLNLALGTTAATNAATIDGQGGTADVLGVFSADAVANSANGTFDGEFVNFERLTLRDALAASGTINLANLTYDYVTAVGTAAAQTLTLNNAAAGFTLALTAANAGNLYAIALADATGGADTVNLAVSNAAATNFGAVTTNGVETFAITSNTTAAAGAQHTLAANGDTATTINVSGNAGLILTSNAATLTTVDASGLTGTGANGGLTFTAANNSMTVTGGAGNDAITVTGDSATISTGAGADTIIVNAGADLATLDGGAGNDTFDFNGVSTNKSNFAVINNAAAGDIIDLAGIANLTAFNATAITLAAGATQTTQAFLDQAISTLATNTAGFFVFNGDSYIVADVSGNATNFVDGTDFVVKLTGVTNVGSAYFNATADQLVLV